jgi:putative addiction module component (TIGR02574 family)
MSPLEELESAVLALPREERARLAQRLLASLDEEADAEEAWHDEVRRRLQGYRAGREATVSREDVLREARMRYGS